MPLGLSGGMPSSTITPSRVGGISSAMVRGAGRSSDSGMLNGRPSGRMPRACSSDTAVSRRPDYYRAHVELGAYHSNRGDFTRAVAPLRRALDLAPDEPNVRFALGATYLNLGMFGEAEQRSEEHTSELQSLRHLVC